MPPRRAVVGCGEVTKPKRRPPASIDIERELANARYYLALMLEHETAAIAADEAQDAARIDATKTAFLRELSSFLNAGRTAKNYLLRAAIARGQESWVRLRLEPPVFRFHADVGGVKFHETSLRISQTASVRMILGKGPAALRYGHGVDGSLRLESVAGNAIRSTPRLAYNTVDLGEDLANLLLRISKNPLPIVELANLFVVELEHVLKNAIRNGRI